MDLRKQIEVAQSQSFSKMSGVYLCPELSMPAVRPGADDLERFKLFFDRGIA